MDITTALAQIEALHEASAALVEHLQALRAAYTDDQYEALEEQHPAVADLISACCDVEAAMESDG
jgi:hypothetical protein